MMITIKHGTKEQFKNSSIPLSSGEIAFLTDTCQLVVGHGDGGFSMFNSAGSYYPPGHSILKSKEWYNGALEPDSDVKTFI